MMDMLSAENRVWLSDFIERYGRKPRVLLIGNIANNAYNNAKILNQAGLDCDVICYDYYHVMGCPEWEDADLPWTPTDDFRPDWRNIPVGDYRRPEWFAQGPMHRCIDYLISRRTSSPNQLRLWRLLLICSLVTRPRNFYEWYIWLQADIKRRIFSYLGKFSEMIRHYVPALWSRVRWVKRLALRQALRLRAWQGGSQSSFGDDSSDATQFLDERTRYLIDEFKAEFPQRTDCLTLDDIQPYTPFFARWRTLLSHYDIVVGFSTDPFRPLLCGQPYFAVEHGTLREIPFAPDAQGRRTSLAYRLAQHCFVTNFDCASNASELAPMRYTLMNHPYDEDHGLSVLGASELREKLCAQLDCDFLFFHPTRQDWVDGTGYADKRNEVFLNAFAQLRQQGLRVGLVACSWGANVSQSQELLVQMGCDAHALWIPPLAITPFERMCKACDVVVDQFKLGAFGGVVFKAMAVASPIITFINEDLLARQYPELPPIINCRTTYEINVAVNRLVREPEWLRQVGQQSRVWIEHHHSKRETINKQLDQFRLLHAVKPT